MTKNSLSPHWGTPTRILFRFVFVYVILYSLLNLLPLALSVFPLGATIYEWYAKPWNALVVWVGTHIFHVEISLLPTGSGDTTYHYLEVLCFLVLATAATVVWTLVDRRRASYGKLNEWLRVSVRFGLAVAMLFYGAVKVIKTQFMDPSLDRLLQPIGDASPMGLLWTFMGASDSYTVFTGVAEMLGGILLTTRRTTLLGALVCVGALSHVVMLNFSYDVPVKLLSSHLLALAVFLVIPDARRLANLCLFNRPVEPVAFPPLFGRSWLNRGTLVLRTLFVASIVTLFLYDSYKLRKEFGDLAPRSPLYGIWNVEEFIADGEVRPPLITDATRWRRVIFDRQDVIGIHLMSDARQLYLAQLDPERTTLTLERPDDPSGSAELSYQQLEPGLLALEGQLAGKRIRVTLRRNSESEFPLVGRSFHWINEVPYSR